MHLLLSLILALIASAPAGATHSSDRNPQLIVPGQRIGRARLGMNRPAIDAVNRTTLCPVVATYDASGHAMWLQTSWGGGCPISDKIQVGLFAAPVLRAFGAPDRVIKDARYPHTVAFWLVYGDRGLGFRILGWFPEGIIQAIAVFPGTASHLSNESNSATARDAEAATRMDATKISRGTEVEPQIGQLLEEAGAYMVSLYSDAGNGDGSDPAPIPPRGGTMGEY